MIRLTVIEQQLLARFYVPQCEKEDVAMDDPAVTVGFAGMVDELRAIAAAATINRPVRVNATDVKTSFVLQTELDFVTGDSFAGIFGDLAPLFESDCGETASAVNPGLSDFNAWGEPCLFYPISPQSTDNGR
jgi:hypothetical protein